MNDLPEDSPAARAAERLAALILACDGIGEDSAGFDPWPIAEAWEDLQAASSLGEAADALASAKWARLHDDATAAQARYVGPLLRSPAEKRLAAQRCLELRPQIVAGDGGSVMDAIASCVSHGIVVPGWLAVEFVKRQQRVVRGQCKDWTDALAFGKYYGIANTAGVRAANIYGPWAYEVACELLAEDPSRALSRDGLYEEVGERIKRSHSQVFELIRDYVMSTDGVNPPLVYLRDGLAKGLERGEVVDQWFQARYDAHLKEMGCQEGADGVWRVGGDPEN